MANPDPDKVYRRIATEDLRSECIGCGGYGKKPWADYPKGLPIRYAGPCGRCAGSGKTYPRKVHQ